MASSRRLMRPSIEYLDRLVKEYGAEYVGGNVDNGNGVSFTKFQLTVYDCIKKNPGIWRNELARRLGRSAIDAAQKFVRLGIVSCSFDEDGRKRYYLVGDGVGEGG